MRASWPILLQEASHRRRIRADLLQIGVVSLQTRLCMRKLRFGGTRIAAARFGSAVTGGFELSLLDEHLAQTGQRFRCDFVGHVSEKSESIE